MNILALIPARGGSKGIKDKNLREVAGKPLVAHTIEAAKESIASRVIVSTDSERIKDVGKQYGAEVIDRPDEISGDKVTFLPVIKHALEELEKEGYIPDAVAVLTPTSPLRGAEDINGALKLLEEGNYHSVSSGYKLDINPFGIMKIIDGKARFILDTSKAINRQAAGEFYKLNGAIYVIKTEYVKNIVTYILDESNHGFYVMPKEKSFDIDGMEDLEAVSKIMDKN